MGGIKSKTAWAGILWGASQVLPILIPAAAPFAGCLQHVAEALGVVGVADKAQKYTEAVGANP